MSDGQSPTPSPPSRWRTRITRGGWLGMTLLLIGFGLRIGDQIESDAPFYIAVNLIGAALVGAQCVLQRAWPAFAVELGWIVITLVGMWRTS